MTDRPALLPLLAVGTTLVFWASAFVAIRHLGEDIGPGALSLGRLVVGSVALGAVLLARRAWRRPRRADWLPLVAIGLLWFGVYNVALNEGERRVDAGTAAMLIQVAPVLIAVLAVWFLRERSTLALWVGPRGRVRRRRGDQPRDQPDGRAATATWSGCCCACSRRRCTP